MTDPLEGALGVSFVIVGLSHILCSHRWQSFFEPMFENPAGPFYIAMYTLPMGLLVVFTHNRWEWDLGVIATVYGWGAIFKGTLYFLAPAVPLALIRPRMRSAASFKKAGGVLVVLGLLLGYGSFSGG